MCAAHLFEGHLLVIVDTSPSVMIAPTTYFHHLQHAEEYRQSPFIGTFIRWIRFVGVFLSLFLVPIWYLFSEYPELTPDILSFVGPKEEATLSLFIQLFLADMGIEFLRMAAIHTPTPLTTAMGSLRPFNWSDCYRCWFIRTRSHSLYFDRFDWFLSDTKL